MLFFVFEATVTPRQIEIDKTYFEKPLTLEEMVELHTNILYDELKARKIPNLDDKLEKNWGKINRVIEDWVKNAQEARDKYKLFVRFSTKQLFFE